HLKAVSASALLTGFAVQTPEEFRIVIRGEHRACRRALWTQRLPQQHADSGDADRRQQVLHGRHLLHVATERSSAARSGRASPEYHLASYPPAFLRATRSDERSSGAGVVSEASSARTSVSRNRRCPPGVRIEPIRPAEAHRVTV